MKIPQLLVAVGAGVWLTAAFAEDVTVAGSTTVQKRIVEPGAAALKTATGIDIKVQGTGTGKGMMALYEGKVPAALASETLEEAVVSSQKAAKDMDKSVTPPQDLQFHELAKDVIVVILNKDNPVASLTKEQLKGLHTGKITNWKDVGGPDMPVKVVTSHAGSATRAVFQKQIMDGAEYVAGSAEIRTTREEINEVSKDKGAIGAVSEGFYAQNPAKTKIAKSPAITRPLGVVTVGAPKPEVKKVIDFYRSPEGKKLMQ